MCYTVQVAVSSPTRRAIDVLVAVGAEPAGTSLSQVARATSISAATCQAVLTELVAIGIVGRTMDKRYQLLPDSEVRTRTQVPPTSALAVAVACVPALQRETGTAVTLVRLAAEGIELQGLWSPDGAVHRTELLLFPALPPFGLTAVAWLGRRRVNRWVGAVPMDAEQRSHLLRLMADIRRDRYLAWQSSAVLPNAVGEPERTIDLLAIERTDDRRQPILEHPASAKALAYEGILGRDFKSARRMDVAMIVSPIFALGPVPTHQLEVHVFRTGTTRAWRLRVAEAVRDTAAQISNAIATSAPAE